jgi:hypothetical protein
MILPDIIDLAIAGHSEARDTLKAYVAMPDNATVLEEFCARHAGDAPRFAWIHGATIGARGDRACVPALQRAAGHGVAEAHYELAVAAQKRIFNCSYQVMRGHVQAAVAGGVDPAAEFLVIEAWAQNSRAPFIAVQLGVEHKRVGGLVAAIKLEKDRRRTAWLWRRLRQTPFDERFVCSAALNRVSPRMSFETARILARHLVGSGCADFSALRICLAAPEGKHTVRERAAFWLLWRTGTDKRHGELFGLDQV